MPRQGGEAGKLGNRFEGIRTVESLLDLLAADAITLTIEPFGDEALGIEFIKETSAGLREFHSVKRQTTGATWTLYELCAREATGRSILGDLFTKLLASKDNRAVFVSATTANDLNEVCDRARRSDTASTFIAHLDASPHLKQSFDKYIVPLCDGDADKAFTYIKRIEAIGITENELIRHVEQRIRFMLYRPDGGEINPLELRSLLGEFVYARLGQATRAGDVAEFLTQNGYRLRDWSRDATVRERIASINSVYTRQVEAELIQGVSIERSESTTAFAALKSGEERKVAVVGPAGLGKSCAFSQVLRLLEKDNIPVLALRMDLQAQVLTAHSLGKELGLSVSPVSVLAGIANGGRCVLAIDQLDALSYASGRNPHLWNVFEEMLLESERFPNMRVLLACRAFDAEHDPRLRRLIADELLAVRIDLDLLKPELVREVVGRAGVDALKLKEKEVELLRTPLHLNLYLQSDPAANPSFRGVLELFSRYWERKHKRVEERLGRSPKWLEVIRQLTRWLSEHQTLSAPKDILDEFQSDAEAMASEHVLVLDTKTCRFFHETFFDYAFARTFVAGGGKILDLLLASDEGQHLFRRAQVRQILSYQRGRATATYLSELRLVLTEPRVRFHIKRLVLDWLRSLDDPTRDEWALLQSLVSDSKVGSFVQRVPHFSIAWFDLLMKTGTWASWLDSDDEQMVNHAIWLMSVNSVMKARSFQIAALISPHLDKGEIWKDRFLTLIRSGEVYHSREMFDLFVKALQSGWLDEPKDLLVWHSFHDMPKLSPSLAAELLGEYFDRMCKISPTGSVFEDIGSDEALPQNFIHDLEKAAPEDLARQVVPRVLREVQARKLENAEPDLDDRDQLWPYFSLVEEHSFRSSFLPALSRALAILAAEKPSMFEELTQGLLSVPSRTVAFMLLHAWRGNPSRFAASAVDYLVADTRRLALDYHFSLGSGGLITACISRGTIKVIAPHSSDTDFRRLEEAILNYRNSYEQENTERIGFHVFVLLESLPRTRMSASAVATFEELQRKFPNIDFSEPKPGGMTWVGPPIPSAEAEKMTDDEWLSAMRKYASESGTGRRFGEGGVHELATVLEHETQNDKSRFAALALKMSDDIAVAYFDAILRGIVKVEIENAQKERYGPKAQEPLDTIGIQNVVLRTHRLPGHPSGQWICWTIHKCAQRDFSKEVLEVLIYYALNDPDPDKETWQARSAGEAVYYGGDPYAAGINSVRGSAADAISKLLFADKTRWSIFELAVVALVRDKSLAVRASTVACLTALLNLNRERAVELFLQLCDKAESILGSHPVDFFLHYAFHSHYAKLRSLTLDMLKSPLEGAREIASRQIAVASFSNSMAQEDLAAVLAGDEKCRVAAANVFATNFHHASIRETCRKQLRNLFNDQSAKVRDTASWCFRHLPDSLLSEERDLILAFVRSPAFIDGCDDLLFKMKEAKEQLPDVVAAVAGRAISLHLEGGEQRRNAGRASFYLPELVIRLYDQTPDSKTKLQCLDLMDKMLETEFSDIDLQLTKVER